MESKVTIAFLHGFLCISLALCIFLTWLNYNQADIIESQRVLIKSLFQDSMELTQYKIRDIEQKRH